MIYAALAGLLLSGIVVGFAYLTAERVLRVRPRPKTRTPADCGLPYEDVHFSSHGHTLHGWMVKQPGAQPEERLPFVVLLHGWESSAQGMLPHAKYLFGAGHNVFLFDVRGHGDSAPMDYMSLIRFTEDIESALEFLKNRPDVDPQNLSLFGHSLGAAASIVVGARHPEIRAVVVSSSFSFFERMNRDMLKGRRVPYYPFGPILKKFWDRKLRTDVETWSPGRHIARLKTPVLIAFGGRDETLSVRNFEELAAAARPELSDTILIANGTHRNLYEFEEYREKVVQFLARHVESERNLEERNAS